MNNLLLLQYEDEKISPILSSKLLLHYFWKGQNQFRPGLQDNPDNPTPSNQIPSLVAEPFLSCDIDWNETRR